MPQRRKEEDAAAEPLDESEQAVVVAEIVQVYRRQQSSIYSIFTLLCYMAMGVALFVTYMVESEAAGKMLNPAATNATSGVSSLSQLRYLHCLCTMLLHWNTPTLIGKVAPLSPDHPPSLNDIIQTPASKVSWIRLYIPAIASLLVGAVSLWMVRRSFSSSSSNSHFLYYHYILWGSNAVLLGAAWYVRADHAAFADQLRALYKAQYNHKSL